MANVIYSARTLKDLNILSGANGDLRVLAHLGGKELNASASRWRFRHMLAYRLLVDREKDFLDVLKRDHDDQCSICSHEECGPQNVNSEFTKDLIEGCPCSLRQKTHSELLQLPNGPLWVALERAVGPASGDQEKDYPKRERNQVQRRDYTNSGVAILGSSPTMPSSSEFEVDVDSVDEDEHDERRSKSEEVTVNLILCFLQQALNRCLVQHTPGVIAQSEVRPRVEPKRADARIVGTANVTAEDDGGMCVVRLGKQGWTMAHPYLALLEAKRAFKNFYLDENTGNYIPVVSNENLAQYLAEAVITWKANRELLGDSVFLIAATNAFVRFVHFGFSRDYLEYLDATDETSQRELIDDGEKEVFVHMQGTSWFNLQSPEGRKMALCHIFALVRWHDARNAGVEEDSDQSSNFEEDEEQEPNSDMDIEDKG